MGVEREKRGGGGGGGGGEREIGLRRLCQHNFQNNRTFMESGIMRE